MTRWATITLLALAACGDTDETDDTDGGDTDGGCTALTSGAWNGGGSSLGMTMGVTLTMDAGSCTFTLTDWSMNMGDMPDSGSISGSSVAMGSSSYWSGCTGTVDSATSFSGTCGDGAVFEFTGP